MENFYPPVPRIECFPEYEGAPPIIPGKPERDWMDATTNRFAYRCTPLPIANASGWDVVMPFALEATWTGGNAVSDLFLRSADASANIEQVAGSVFGHGILTFHPGYLFRTSPGWALNVRGAPNTVKDGIAPLEGLVETDWLPFPFTMNWRFTRPGTVCFSKGESFCFIAPAPHSIMDAIVPEVVSFESEPDLRRAYDEWRRLRSEFQVRIARNDPEAIKQGWQRDYVHGRDPSGHSEPVFHVSRRRLRAPAPRSIPSGAAVD